MLCRVCARRSEPDRRHSRAHDFIGEDALAELVARGAGCDHQRDQVFLARMRVVSAWRRGPARQRPFALSTLFRRRFGEPAIEGRRWRGTAAGDPALGVVIAVSRAQDQNAFVTQRRERRPEALVECGIEAGPERHRERRDGGGGESCP